MPRNSLRALPPRLVCTPMNSETLLRTRVKGPASTNGQMTLTTDTNGIGPGHPETDSCGAPAQASDHAGHIGWLCQQGGQGFESLSSTSLFCQLRTWKCTAGSPAFERG